MVYFISVVKEIRVLNDAITLRERSFNKYPNDLKVNEGLAYCIVLFEADILI